MNNITNTKLSNQILESSKVFGPIGAIAGFIGDVITPLGSYISWISIALLAITSILIIIYIFNKSVSKINSITKYLPKSFVLTIVFGFFSLIGINSEKGFFGDNIETIANLQSSLFNIEEGMKRVENKVDYISKGVSEIKDIVSGDAELKNMTSTDDLTATKELNDRTKDKNAKRVAILYFDNSGGEASMDKLKKGLADMLITDLSNIRMLNIVERDKLESILKEQKLNNTKEFDASTASKVGKLLGAQIILTGGYFDMMGSLRIDARFIDVETGKILKSDGVDGPTTSFFKIQKQLSWKIIKSMDTKITDEEKVELKTEENAKAISIEDLNDYSKALDFYDQGKKAEAKKIAEKINKKYPDFVPAKNFLKKL